MDSLTIRRLRFVVALLFFASTVTTFAQTRQTLQLSVDAYDRALAHLVPGQTSIKVGDMIYKIEEIKEFRDTLKARLDGRITALATFDAATSRQWANGVVPYAYATDMPEAKKKVFEAAIREWQQVANLNFVPRSSQRDYIAVKFTGYADDAEMNSNVGRQGGAQDLNVANWGNKIDCAHELGHSLGMIHEQMRSDRDTFVTVYPTNVSLKGADYTVNFALVRNSINKGPYDYDSLMHYGRTAFAIDSKYPTIIAKSPNEKWSDGFGPEEIGQKTHLSDGDKSAMASVYGSPLNIEGTVVDAAGNPLSGIQVTLSGGAVYRGANPIYTDFAGHYSFTGIPHKSGTYIVTPSQTGTSFTEASKQATIGTTDAKELNFTTVDAAPPDLHIDSPTVSGVYPSAPKASGTASDTVGLKEVRVALARTSDLVWWNWSENTWGTTTFDWAKNVRIATGKAAWSADLPFLSVGGYQVHVQSVDFGDNASPWLFRHFFVDPEPPVVTVTEPVPGTSIPELMHIRGTATDGNGTGIKDGRVYFTLYQNGDFWTGFNWKGNTSAQDPDVLLWADVVNGEWAYNAVPGGHEHGGAESPNERSGLYALSVFARDNAGNLTVPGPANNIQFTVDNSPPSISVTYPADGATLTNLTTVTGAATDSKSLESVRFYLYSFVNGQFWDGTAWGGGGSAIMPVAVNTANGTWSSTANLPSIDSRNPATRLANGAYNIIAFAVDSAGNQTRSDVVIHIEYYPEARYTAGSYTDQDPNNNNELWDNPANWSGGFVPGPGDIAVIASGAPHFSGSKTVQAVKLTGGEIVGDSLIIPDGGTFSWGGGTLSSHLTIRPGGQLNVSGATGKTLSSGRVIENDGSTLFDGDDSAIHGSGGSKILNNGTLVVDGNPTMFNYNNGIYPIATFENQGIITKQGTGTWTFSPDYGGWALTNGANLEIAAGKIEVNNSTYLGGTISGAGTLVSLGNLHLDSTTTLAGGSVELRDGALTGTGTFTGDGTFIWSGGTLNGDTTLDANLKARLNAGPRTLASGARLQNKGMLSWEAGALNVSGQSRVENSGTFEISGNVAAAYYNNGVYPRGEFENTGLVSVKNGANVIFLNDYEGWHFNNRGETRIIDGKLTLGGGGVSSNATYNIQNGSIELIPGEPHVFRGQISVTGAGTLRVAGGRVTGENATFAIAAGSVFEHNTGTSEGTFVLRGPGTFVWSGGTLNATMEWAADLKTAISGDAEKNLEGGHITQAGNVIWTGAGRLRATGAAEFRNIGIFEIQNDSGFVYYNNGVYPIARFVNSGTLRKTTAAAATSFFDDYGGWAFINNGLLDLQSGSIDLRNTTTLDHGGRFMGAGALRVLAGTTTIAGTNTLEGGTVALVSGALRSSDGWVNGAGTFSWAGGDIGGALNVNVTNFTLNGTADKVLNSGATLRNFGHATWPASGPLRTSGASFFENHGEFDLQDDNALTYYNNGIYPRAAFVNSGVFTKSGGTNIARFSEDYGGAAFDSTGSIQILSGAFYLGGGGAWTNTQVTVANGAELRNYSGRLELAGNNTFSGATWVTGGELALADSTNAVAANSVLGLAGGTLLGSGAVSGPGTFEWSGGAISGTLTIGSNAQMALTGDAEKTFAAGTINNYGHGSWGGNGNFRAQGATLFNNFGEFTLLSDSSFIYYNNGIYPQGRFHNAGALKKSGSAGESTFTDAYSGWDFTSTGTIQIDSGILSLRSATRMTNTVFKGAGRVRLDSAGCTFQGDTRLEGGTFQLAGGFIDGQSTFSGTGALEWSGGELRGAQTIAPNARMLISGADTKNIAGSSSLTNYGTIAWTGTGPIRGVGQSRLVNNGTFDIQNDGSIVYYNNGIYPIASFENNGTILKSNSEGTTAFSSDYGGWHFANTGTLDIRSGTFEVGPNYEPAATSRTVLHLSGTEPGTDYGSLKFPGAASLTGALVVELADGFVPATNMVFTLATYPSNSGEFISPALPSLPVGRAWNLDYQPNKLNLSITGAVTAQNGSASFESGKFSLSLNGPSGQYALLQSTTNLIDWVSIQTNQPFAGQFLFSDPSATNAAKFYRTIIVP